MLNLEELKSIAKLMDEMDVLVNSMERDYNNKDGEQYSMTKNSILNIQSQIKDIIK